MNTSLIKTVLRQSPVAYLQTAALLIFLGLFVAILIWVFWPGAKSYYQNIANDFLKEK